MRPTFRQLEYIVAVAETGQIGLAAQQLNVSQPSLSAQLSQVEADLGVKLFHRGRSGSKLTPVGRETVRRARLILRDVYELRETVKADVFQGQLRFGVLPSIGPYLLPNVVRRLHLEHPGFRMVVREENTQDLDEGLRNGRLDMLISTPDDHPGTLQVPLFSEGFWAAVADDHPLADSTEPLSLKDLTGEVLLTLGPKYRLSHIVANLARKAGARVSDEYEGTSLDAIRLMAATGAGIAILPQIYAATEARRGTDVRLRRVAARDAVRDIALIQPELPEARPGTRQIAALLVEEGTRIIGGR